MNLIATDYFALAQQIRVFMDEFIECDFSILQIEQICCNIG